MKRSVHPSLHLPCLAFALMAFANGLAHADDGFAALCSERAAIERVYHDHRTGTKPAFEQAMTTAVLETLVRDDLKKKAVLELVYGVKIDEPIVQAEVRRINATTRAPEILAEIKSALGNDPARFARAMAEPLVVERTLRTRFDNDDPLHAPQRRLTEAVRARLLGIKEGDFTARFAALKESHQGEVQEPLTWTLAPRSETDPPPAPPMPGPAAVQSSGGVYRNEATAQVAQPLATLETNREETELKLFFEDLTMELRNVLHAQLRSPGDVSAVIETPAAFQVYLARERTTESLSAAILTVRKRSYEEWLAAQAQP